MLWVKVLFYGLAIDGVGTFIFMTAEIIKGLKYFIGLLATLFISFAVAFMVLFRCVLVDCTACCSHLLAPGLARACPVIRFSRVCDRRCWYLPPKTHGPLLRPSPPCYIHPLQERARQPGGRLRGPGPAVRRHRQRAA